MANVSSSNSQGVHAPSLRFPEFSDEWTLFRLGDIYTERKESGNESLGILTVSIHSGVSNGELDEESLGKRVKRSEDKSTYKKANTGDLVFNMMRAWQGAIGTVRTSGMVSPAYIVAIPNDMVDPEFMDYYVKTRKMINHIHRLSYGVTDFRLRLYWESFVDLQVRIPSLTEQAKLAHFLTILDKRIRKQKEYVNALKSYKRGLSSALFHRKIHMKKSDGSLFPEWDEATLGDVFSERNERAAGGEKLLAVTINSGVQERSNLDLKDNSSEDKSNYRKVHIGDIAYNTMRMWQGACGVSAYDGIVSPAYTVLYVSDKSKSEPRYWAFLFKEIKMMRLFQRNSQGLTSDTWNLKFDKFSKITVKVPSFEEQTVIANYIDNFSRMITIYEDSLEQMENYRRSVLSQMFI